MSSEERKKSGISFSFYLKTILVLIAILLVLIPIGDLKKIGLTPITKTLSIFKESPQNIGYPDTLGLDSLAIKKHAAHGWPICIPIYKKQSLPPHNFIVAYYGTVEHAKMGIVGQYPQDEVVRRLNRQADEWKKELPDRTIIPAIQQIAVVAQNQPSNDNQYRRRVPFKIIDQAYRMARQANGILILDIQPGRSNVKEEVPFFKSYLLHPDVNLAIDPEFYMHGQKIPGQAFGHIKSSEINWCIQYLKDLVISKNLPPKVLIIHRFFKNMLIHDEKINLVPEVQLIIEMDGFGSPALKRNSYQNSVYKDPISFSGFKLFYKNDISYGKHMMTPKEVMSLFPAPVYVQYQ